MNVYRVYVGFANKSKAENLEFYVRADNKQLAVIKVLQTTPGLKEFSAIAIEEKPNGVIIE